MAAQLVRLLHQQAVIERLPDQTPGLGFSAGSGSAVSASARARRRTDQPRQDPGAARIRNEPDLGKSLHEARRPGGQHDVAGEGDIGAGAGRHAVDRGDHRQRQLAELADERIVIGLQRAAEHRRLAALRQPVIEILTSAETAPGAGQQQRPTGRIVLRFVSAA